MLQVKDVKKKYVTGDFEQIALNGVSLNLRDNEFVAILGPSGSGKTTLLNIIGGLDRYDSGDLIINGVSTRKYKDRDWDSYRNHTVGFVFQSYNLIPHQTVLSNVELALTIGGVSASRRKQMALDALEQVGLREQAHKKPNQMSGGQMQRVAIARALVNNPRILLADEPTGALDTKTSVQVMELLKEVAKDRLVVMVTHNPELAEEYANRIVRVKDGNLVGDSNPLIIEEDMPAVHRNLGKSSMSLLTSFGLSLNNLMTKKGRTILTAFAGSIGIIGIATILSLSTGFQNYIDQIQEETMTSYPLTIYEEAADIFSALLSMHTDKETASEPETLVEQQNIESMMSSMTKNDLRYFKSYLESHEEEYADDIKLIQYSYSVSPTIYTIDAADNIAQINPNTTMSAYGSTSGLSMLSSYSSMGSTFSEITDLDKMKEEYPLLAGTWPENYNELIAVVNDPGQISDLLLYSLGFRNTKELKNLIQSVMSGEIVTTGNEPMTVTYEELLDHEMKLINPADLYRYNEEYGTYEDMSGDRSYMEQVYENAEDLKIVGIALAEGDKNAMSTGVMYLPELTFHVIDLASESEIVRKQLADKDTDVFSGNAFGEESEETGLDFQNMISVDEDMIADAFQMDTSVDTSALSGLGSLGSMSVSVDSAAMQSVVMTVSQGVAQNIETMTETMRSVLVPVYQQITEPVTSGMIEAYNQAFTIELPDVGLDQLPSIGDIEIPGIGGGDFTLPDMQNGTSAEALEQRPRTTTAPANSSPAEEAQAAQPQTFAQTMEPTTVTADQESSTIAETAGGQTTGGQVTASPDTKATDTNGADTKAQDTEAQDTKAQDTEAQDTEAKDTEAKDTEAQDTEEAETEERTEDSDSSSESEESIIKAGKYLLVNVGGTYLPDLFKSQAISDEMLEELCSKINDAAGGQITISKDTMKAIVSDGFDNYYRSLTPNLLGIVPADQLPDPSAAIEQAFESNQSLIFEEAYTQSKEYTTYMVAAGVGQAVNGIVTPMMSGIAGSLSGLSALSGLSDMFSEDMFTMDTEKFAEAFQFDMNEEELSRLMESMLTGEDASYTNNLLKLGYQDLDAPSSISFYFKDFESKGNFTDWLTAYNEAQDEDKRLTYSDITGLLMGSVETIINSVTYVLIAFVSISLIVSSIMIGIITYISVLERTKEIGILRAIGASKHNISSIFNAETFIIGFLSGLIGVGTTYLLNVPINSVIHKVSNNPDITAVLDPRGAVILVAIATLLTMLGGLIPSGSASRKDPVIALRTD